MTVTGMAKSIQTHNNFAFWKQILLNAYTIILRKIILIFYSQPLVYTISETFCFCVKNLRRTTNL